MEPQQQNLRMQRWIVFIAVLLFAIKIIAWLLTRSVAVLTDALESIVNVIAGFIGLYSLSIAAKPRDKEHPYGHGKAEFLSAAIEGTLISIAGGIIIYEAIDHLVHPSVLQRINNGIILVSITAAVNYFVGYISIRKGRRNNSLALIASGRHLQSDTYSTIGIVVGLALIYFTGLQWLDSAVAMIFGVIIIITGYRILRSSIAGIMDEADLELLTRMIDILNGNRRPAWIDLHNLRVIKYGGTLHVDCHLTVPWYLNVHEAHEEVEALGDLIRNEFHGSIELFVHTDACFDFSCPICTKDDCAVRQQPFQRQVAWTLENVISDRRHRVTTRA